MRIHIIMISPVFLALLAPSCAPPPDVVVDDTSGSTGSGEASTSVAAGSSGGADTTAVPTDTTAVGTSTSDSSTSDSSTSDSSTTDTGTEPVCGDGIVDVGESCDDAGASATCDVDCTPVECGDGVLNDAAGEQCDDAGESAVCDADCTLAPCGDGIVNATAGEQCDDAGESALCNVDCTPATCGDGIFNATAGEACDGAGRTAACNLDCTLAECGDGITNVMAGEQCDDAGESPSCNSDCSSSECGDGITNVTAGEQCDDAGASLACDGNCTVAACGDMMINAVAGEQCEGMDLAGATCQSLGLPPGTLACSDACTYDTSACVPPPAAPVLSLSFSPIKQFDFSWPAVPGTEHYELLESPAPGEPFAQLGGSLEGTSTSITMPLHLRYGASYVLRACNAGGCTESLPVNVVSSLAEAVGYLKASNTNASDEFGGRIVMSADGSTLAVAAALEDGSATGIDGNQASNAAADAGAVYVFTRDAADQWTQQAYVKASNTNASDLFGYRLALSDDGSTLAVSAAWEDGGASGINGNQADNSVSFAGAVYVFTRNAMGQWSQQAYVKSSNPAPVQFFCHVALSGDGNTLAVGATNDSSIATNSGSVHVFVRNGAGAWSQQDYLKASNVGAGDGFGRELALSADGNTLAVSALGEDSSATGVDGNQADDSAESSGAVYVFVRDGAGDWSQQAYAKASNTATTDAFGNRLALSGDGDTLAVVALNEDSSATGIDGDQADDSALQSGAVYLFVRDGAGVWSQQAYVKASNTAANDSFGSGVTLSADGNTLAVGASREASNAVGIGGDQASNVAGDAGAVYVLVRDAMGQWSQRAYVKAPNTDISDYFGTSVSLSGDGRTLAVSAPGEGSNATGVGGDQANDSLVSSGAVYLY